MIRKYYIILLVFCFFMLFSITNVFATEVSDRDIAIACILASGNHSDGITVAEDLGEGPDRIRNYGDRHELDDWFIVDFSNNWLANLGMTALVLEKDNNVIISFRGTDTEWLEDAVNGVLNFHIQELPANIYVKKILKQYSEKEGNYKFYVTGYSLGGYIAQTAGATIEKESSKYPNIQLAKIMDFNGIGINFLTLLGNLGWGGHTDEIEILKKLGDEGRLVDYYIYGDIISAAGMHYGEMRSILPSIDTVSEISSNYSIFNTAEKIVPISSLVALLMENTLNAFKTEIFNAAKTYNVFSIIGFLDLTHGGTITEFGSLNYIEADETPKVIISNNDKVIGEEGLNISKTTTLKAETYNASVKTYKWYVSNDGETWGEPIKEINLYKNDVFESPTNTFNINIEDFNEGETKYYKVESFFDDKYNSSKYEYNKKILQYEYVKNEEKSSHYNSGTTETIIKVTYQTKIESVTNWFTSLFNKYNPISKILNTFTDFGGFINSSTPGFSSIINNFSEDALSSSVQVAEKVLTSLLDTGNFILEPSTDFNTNTLPDYNEMNQGLLNILDVQNSNDNNINTDILGNTTNDILDILNPTNNNIDPTLCTKTYHGDTYKLAITDTTLNNTLSTIASESITQQAAQDQNYKDANKRSDDISTYHIYMLLGKVSNPTLDDCMSRDNNIGIPIKGIESNLKECIDNNRVCRVHVQWNNSHWITCVGYKNEGSDFSDFLFISSNTGELIVGEETQEANGFYTIQRYDAIRIFN